MTGSLIAVANTSTAKPYEVAQVTVSFRGGDLHARKLTDSDGTAMAEGDMIFGKSEDFFGRADKRQTRGLSNTSYGRIWPNGLVPYRISSNLSSSAKLKVRDAIEHWNSFKAITLVERTSSNASAYPDFVDFVKDDRCASWIGYQGNGAQSIYTGDKCSTGTMIHEIGHALGLLHEHTRPDRDQYVKVHWDRIPSDMHINFEIMEGSILLGDYDYGSIMHYGEHFFSNSRLPTIEPLQATNETIGQRVETSTGDRAAIAKLYRSDISLIANSSDSAAAGSSMDVEFIATNNNTTVGSNNLSINVPVPVDSELLSYASSSWMCTQGSVGQDVNCTTPILPASASSTVAINITATRTTGTMLLDAQLSSRTLDTDLSDNYDTTNTTIIAASDNVVTSNTKRSADVPQMASALDGGAGSADPKELIFMASLLLMISWYRRRITNLQRQKS